MTPKLHTEAGIRRWEPVAALLVILLFVAWSIRALAFPDTADAGLMLAGGDRAWFSGRPETLETWISTPFLAMVMALISRFVHAYRFSKLITALNVVVVAGLLGTVWAQLRSHISRATWWLTITAAVLFAPLVSAVWWRQISVVAFALAIIGFEAARRRRPLVSGLLIALSLSLKPVLILLPLAMLWRADSRRAAVRTILSGAVMEATAQGFLAWRAKDVGVLLPIQALQNFSDKALPTTTHWVCNPENYSPQSSLCRLAGWSGERWDFQRPAVGVFVIVAVLLVAESLRGRQGLSWHLFAFAALLSPMVSPIAWSHYQLFLAPMFLILFADYRRQGATPGQWALLGSAFMMVEMTWRPFFTLPNSITTFFAAEAPAGPPPSGMLADFAVSELAQYVVLLAALLWFHGSQLGQQRALD